MSTPVDKDSELRAKVSKLYTDYWNSGISGQELQAKIMELVQQSNVEALILPKPFDGQQINNCTNVEDQEYMRGFNRCLEDIKELHND